jgi:ring-1,2-phenylacetyl-CoA epoxidase subunit PaaE
MIFNLFKKKKDKDGSSYNSLIVYKIIKETPDAITIVFNNPKQGKLEYKAGQYLTCIFSIEGKEQRRCYSLNSSPFSDELPAITIKRDPKGTVSNYLFENVKEGDEIKILLPSGNFTTNFDKQNKRHLFLVAGGSGITPLMSILQTALAVEPETQVTLVYINRDETSIIFKDRLSSLEKYYPKRFKIIHVLSQPSKEWTGVKGRLTPEMLKRFLETSPQHPNTEYYICGPGGLMKMVEDVLTSRNVAVKDIRKERFVVEETDKKSNGKASLSEITLLLDKQEYHFKVKPGKTILEAALDNDISMPYSCQSGICSTCRCFKLEGEISMDEDEGLTEEEIKQGYVLICVGRPLTPKVKLKAD